MTCGTPCIFIQPKNNVISCCGHQNENLSRKGEKLRHFKGKVLFYTEVDVPFFPIYVHSWYSLLSFNSSFFLSRKTYKTHSFSTFAIYFLRKIALLVLFLLHAEIRDHLQQRETVIVGPRRVQTTSHTTASCQCEKLGRSSPKG